MDELPELPFEQVLSYLSLKDRLKARTVSKAWRNKFDRYPVTTLCCSARSSDFILGKSRLVSGAFAKNFISSTRFTSFFGTFSQTILSSLKHLRLCHLNLSEADLAVFTRTLNSFSQVEELDMIEAYLNQQGMFKLNLYLNLPMLTSLQLENIHGIEKLTLEAPTLRQVKLSSCSELRLEIVYGESVERLLVDWLQYTDVKKLKNLQYLSVNYLLEIDSTLLSRLQQLKEFHLLSNRRVSELFEQKQRYNRTDLKIYLCGLLLNGPDDPAINALYDSSSSSHLSRESLVCLSENRSRMTDQIPFHLSLYYSDIEDNVPGLDVDVLKRFTNLNKVRVVSPIRYIELFLDLLKNCKSIVEFRFELCDQPQDLFNRLPEHSAVQRLHISHPPLDLDFLFRLKHLIDLELCWSIDIETIRKAFEELPVLSYFWFEYDQKRVSIQIDKPKQFEVWIYPKKKTTVFDLNAAIGFIVEHQ